MDGRGFDALTRALGARAGRRAAVLGALAVLWGGRTAKAQDLLRLGETCTSAWQCDPYPTCAYEDGVVGVDCADNGYVDDGPLNCCRWEGGWCDSDAGCCGGLLCITAQVAAHCGVGQCLPREAVGVVYIGGTCTETHQCRQDEGVVICSAGGICCQTVAGGLCHLDQDCCGGMTCVLSGGQVPHRYGYCT